LSLKRQEKNQARVQETQGGTAHLQNSEARRSNLANLFPEAAFDPINFPELSIA
jgi:hypothetical protein